MSTPTVPAGEAPPIIRIEALSKNYGGLQAVNRVSMAVPEGTFYGIIGPNGSGKSTLLDCISGVVRDYKGKVWFDGTDISRWRVQRIARRGLLRTYQVSRVFERMSVMSNVMAAAPTQPGEHLWEALFTHWERGQGPILRQARELLGGFSLSREEDSYAAELSGGQRRLLELVRLSMMAPRAVLLDEPFAGVSPANRARLSDRLRQLCESGVTVIMVEHRLELVEQLCHRVAVMAEGQVMAEGSMADLRKDRRVIDAYLGSVSADAARM